MKTLVTFLVVSTSAASYAQNYRVESLYALPSVFTEIAGVRTDGTSYGTYVPQSGPGRGFTANVWGIREVPAPGNFSRVEGLNTKGQTVGYGSANGGPLHVYYNDGTTAEDLGTMGGESAQAFAINDAGQIVGRAYIPTLPFFGRQVAYRYTNGVAESLGTLGGEQSNALDINNSGLVVGYADLASGDRHAFLYGSSGMQDLGTLGGRTSQATAINDLGMAVGWSTLANSAGSHAFLYANGAMTDIGDLGTYGGSVNAVNSFGVAVGFRTEALDVPVGSQTVDRAVVLRNGNAYTLNSLMLDTGYQADRAWAIDDAGRIFVEGSFGSERRMLMLTPTAVPEPATIAFLGLAVLGVVRKRGS